MSVRKRLTSHGSDVYHLILVGQGYAEGRFEPDYHAGSIETAQMHTFFPQRVNAALAKTLSPSDSFHPMAYCGDPASFESEESLPAFYRADLETDARKIEIVLSKQRAL